MEKLKQDYDTDVNQTSDVEVTKMAPVVNGKERYYSELELSGGAVTVSFSKYLPWHLITPRRIMEQVVLSLRTFQTALVAPPS
jgi:hypothetical protein